MYDNYALHITPYQLWDVNDPSCTMELFRTLVGRAVFWATYDCKALIGSIARLA